MTAPTSDFVPRPNGVTREEWLHQVLYSGQVTRIGQHLAVVIYHLSDRETNVAKASVRDLDRITGWSRPTIMDHLSELDVFIRVTWGAGRAKSLFELQGVITEAIRANQEEETPLVVANQVAAAVAKEVAENSSGNSEHPETANTASPQVAATEVAKEVASEVATNPAETVVANQVAAVVAKEVAESGKNSATGGTIGGENNNYPNNSLSLSVPLPRPPIVGLQPDGSFEGHAFDLPAIEVEGIALSYPMLSMPGDLVAADRVLKRDFDREERTPSLDERMARLHQYLAKCNRQADNNSKTAIRVARSKPFAERERDQGHRDVFFDGDAKIQVMNGFREELLQLVQGDEGRLRLELDCAAGSVGTGMNPIELKKKVRSKITQQVREKIDKDERYAKAASNKTVAPTVTHQKQEDSRDIILGSFRNRRAAKQQEKPQ